MNMNMNMNMNNIVLTVLILLMLTYAIYEELIVNLLNGKTKLKIKLRRKNRIDAVIFIILIAIVIYHNIIQHGSQLTTYLLMITIIIAVYLTFIRYPKFILKIKVFTTIMSIYCTKILKQLIYRKMEY